MKSHNKNLSAKILNIQRMSTEDGPGIRTTIFFKGCGLNCAWCHNPESISFKSELQWFSSRCILCKLCLQTCPKKALVLDDLNNTIKINRKLCNGCKICSTECPTNALELLGKEWSLDDLLNEVIKDISFFNKSDGGVTVSGGEPGMQIDFVVDLFKKLRKQNIHTAFDTCGYYKKEIFDRILPYTSLVLFDLKESDSEKHKTFTEKSNDLIFSNLKYLSQHINKAKHHIDLWIRTPIIPKHTATKINIKKIGKFIANNLSDTVTKWELCTFNNLCVDKYNRLDKEWNLKNHNLIKQDEIKGLIEVAKDTGVSPSIICYNGPVSLNKNKDK